MSLVTLLADFVTRAATEDKSLRTLINGNQPTLAALTTTAQNNLVAAINELDALIGAGSPTTLDDLTDVTMTGPTTGHLIRHNGTTWVNVLGSTFFDPAGTAAAAVAALIDSSPALLDTLNELAAALGDDPNFATTMTNALAGKQPLDADLTALAALTTTAFGRSVLETANAAAARTLIDVYSKAEIGDITTDFVAVFNAGLV